MEASIMILVIIAAVVILLIAVIVLASGVYLRKKYYEAWNTKYYRQFDDPRLQVIAHGLLAPNSHNMQAWKIVLDGIDKNSFWLYINADRLTPQVDPYSRQIAISQGTFLTYIVVSSEKLGYKADIEVFPQGEFDEMGNIQSIKNKPVAKVTLKQQSPATAPLYEMMFLPHTSRVAYKADRLPEKLVNKLTAINNVRVTVYQDDKNLQELKKIAWEAANIEAGVARIGKETQELFRHNEYQKNKYRYGFSLEGQGISGINMAFIEALLTLFPSMNNQKTSNESFLKSTRVALDNTPTFITMISKDNSRGTQVRVGMLYSHLQLICQSEGFYLQPMSQALEEYPEIKAVYDKIHAEYAGKGEAIQMLARVGQPVRKVDCSMRIGVSDLVSK